MDEAAVSGTGYFDVYHGHMRDRLFPALRDEEAVYRELVFPGSHGHHRLSFRAWSHVRHIARQLSPRAERPRAGAQGAARCVRCGVGLLPRNHRAAAGRNRRVCHSRSAPAGAGARARAVGRLRGQDRAQRADFAAQERNDHKAREIRLQERTCGARV